jgi:hypothetical protein
MTDGSKSLWCVIEARDAGIARLLAIVEEQHQMLVEKERVIGRLGTSITEKEGALLKLAADLEGKERALAKLTGDLEEKDDALARLTDDLEEKGDELARLTEDLEDKDKTVVRLNVIIADQSRSLTAFNQTFEVIRDYVGPLTHLLLGVRSARRRLNNRARQALSIFGGANRVVLGGARRAGGRARAALQPRLGVLHQHPPLALRLPKDYSRAVAGEAPRISIVTPSYKHAAFIERTVRSVLDQGYPNVEYYVQDAASGDGTVEVLQRYGDRLAGWRSEPDRGQAEAINRAFALTGGEIMAYLNSDDVLLPGALAYVADYFSRHPDVDVVYGHRVVIDAEDREIGRWILPAHDDEVLSWADYVPQETLFWRRRIWQKAGGRMDESFAFALDWDLLVRFREAGARMVRLPRLLGGFRVHPQQKTIATIAETGFQEMNRIRERVLGRVPSGLEVRKAVLPYLFKHVVADIRWTIGDKLGVNP